jgi:hypothetical protein
MFPLTPRRRGAHRSKCLDIRHFLCVPGHAKLVSHLTAIVEAKNYIRDHEAAATSVARSTA